MGFIRIILAILVQCSGPEKGLDECVGNYKTQAGETIPIRRAGSKLYIPQAAQGGKQLTFASDSPSGPKFRLEETEFYFKLDKNKIRELVITDSTGKKAVAEKIKLGFHMEEVKIPSGIITISGTLVTPLRTEPHPVIIMLRGSGRQTRDTCWNSFAPVFAQKGIAVLTYDKRGSGESITNGEDYPTIHELAQDAMAAATFLKNRFGIKRDSIGIWGSSEGGMVALLAATMCKDIEFLILISTPAVPLSKVDIYQKRYLLASKGWGRDTVENAIQEWQLFNKKDLMQFENEEDLRKYLGCFSSKKWWEILIGMTEEAIIEIVMKQKAGGKKTNHPAYIEFDPVEALQKITCPLLALYGEKDVVIDSAESASLMRQYLTKAGNKDFIIRIFPDADHGIMQSNGKPAPNLFKTQIGWILKHIED